MADKEILLMIGASLPLILAAVILLRQREKGKGRYEVFRISNGKLTVLSGVPVTYGLETIEKVEFSKFAMGKAAYKNFTGVIRIRKVNGSGSRPFLFDASAFHKKMVLRSSEEEIELATRELMEQLKRYGIESVKK